MPRGNYNGFTPEDQKRGGQLQTTGYGNGMLVRQWECEACTIIGKVPGDIIAHLEDYSDPFDGAIWLCYRCHTMLHARFNNPKDWDSYRNLVAAGYTYPLAKSYHRVLSDHRAPQSLSVYWARRPSPPRERTILDDIHDGVLLPGAESYERMRLIHEMGIKFFRRSPQKSLF